MRTSYFLSCALVLVVACTGDGDSTSTGFSSGQTSMTTAGGSTGDSGGSSGTGTTAGSTGGSTAGTTAASTGGSTTATSTATTSGSGTSAGSSGGGNVCDPVVPGVFADCKTEAGTIDNKACMWMGTGDSVGYLGCLTSASDENASVCMISDCVDVCDCFAPPATGTAVVVCADILAGGGMACALDCADGKTCPDGMTCLDNVCFWPPAP